MQAIVVFPIRVSIMNISFIWMTPYTGEWDLYLW